MMKNISSLMSNILGIDLNATEEIMNVKFSHQFYKKIKIQ